MLVLKRLMNYAYAAAYSRVSKALPGYLYKQAITSLTVFAIMAKRASTESRIQRNQHYLHVLASCPPKVRRSILQTVGNDLALAVCECAFNILRGVPALTKRQKQQLRPFRKLCRDLCSRTCSVAAKRQRLINQKGSGFFTALLGPVLAALPWLLKK